LLADQRPDVVLLQECKRRWLETVCEATGMTGVHAHQVDPLLPASIYPPDGTAIAVRAPLSVERAWRIPPEEFLTGTVQRELFEVEPPDLEPMPDRLTHRYSGRSLLAEISSVAGRFVVASFHATPGTSTVGGMAVHEWKPFFHGAVALHLARLELPFLFAIDANEPLAESAESIGFHWADGRSGAEKFRALLGLEPMHNSRDLYREWHRDRGLEAASPELLTATYAPNLDFRRRFDSMWATQSFRLVDFSTHLDDVVAAGGDHAMLVADVHLAEVEP